jgi:hypothetical protein
MVSAERLRLDQADTGGVILKERLFGLTNAGRNNREDVKECYFYLDATPTPSYLKMLYKYPRAEFRYADLIAVDAAMFGGNTNWRGPVWFPINVMLIRLLPNLRRGAIKSAAAAGWTGATR